MTREQKLALIVGFSLILLVGVLISDHLSRAREARVAAVNADESLVVNEAQPVLPDPTRLIPRTEYAAIPAPSPTGVVPVGVPSEPVLPEERRIAAADPVSPAENLASVPRPEPGPAPVEIAQGRYLNDGSEAPVAEPEDALVREVAELGGQIVDSVIHLPAAAQTMRPPIPSAVISMNTKATEPAAAPATEWHTVAKGESLFVIAKRHYGDGKHWRKLAEHNKGRVGEDGSVRVGVRLAIPAPDALGIKSVAGVGAEAPRVREPAREPDRPSPKQPEKKAEPAKPATKSGGKTALASYTVKKGDTLGELSQRFFGSVKRKGDLIAMNKDRIKDEDSIRVGMVLRVPATN